MEADWSCRIRDSSAVGAEGYMSLIQDSAQNWANQGRLLGDVSNYLQG